MWAPSPPPSPARGEGDDGLFYMQSQIQILKFKTILFKSLFLDIRACFEFRISCLEFKIPLSPITLSPYRRFGVSFQLKSIRRSESQKGPVNHPIPHIVIKTSPSLNPLLNFLWNMGVAENDDLKAFQKLPAGKNPEGRGRRGRLFLMIFLITL